MKKTLALIGACIFVVILGLRLAGTNECSIDAGHTTATAKAVETVTHTPEPQPPGGPAFISGTIEIGVNTSTPYGQ